LVGILFSATANVQETFDCYTPTHQSHSSRPRPRPSTHRSTSRPSLFACRPREPR